MAADSFQVSILASSSQGNSLLVKTPHEQILVDAGLSGKKIQTLLQSVGSDMRQIAAILVTHEHSDHIRGVGVLARRYGVPIYANQKTWQAMAPKIGKVPLEQQHIFAPESCLSLGDLEIESFRVSHDAADPQFYNLHYDNKSFIDLTDTGYVSDRVKYQIQNADGILLECNHDVEMLRQGNYPWSLQQRILGDEGHLSNLDSARTLSEVIGNATKQVYLGHRSPHNNERNLAHQTVAHFLEDRDYAVDHDFRLWDTAALQATPLISL
ncbi:MBL fold metallo-hydrolase [Lactobacillus sp. DCY120]|uniref:MBL fold metallo-hydrolase n=1 Tax=Bombilactobacillus apium TaxID=2675299 RepID=A0A850RCQ5_9LACO|nr:MBL fold metallo-hydrolase [Bombilactobacillus apium]NVY96548.1 MBL fold metallo-hydrolase [Bombilactobacillus apium]